MNDQAADAATGPRWQPLSSIDRRVAGVLVEKAKTTPEAYPLSLNAVRTGANQKNNRFPVMELELDGVEQSLDRLRKLGAVGLVQGGGRVERFRHYLYDWLGVDKVELAVMAELLLRGAQTEGELRGRASRMESIADLAALRPVLDSLKAKGLVVSLSREGRGHVVSHALYQPAELEKLRAQYAAWSSAATDDAQPPSAAYRPDDEAQPAATPRAPLPAHATTQASVGTRAALAAEALPPAALSGGDTAALRRELVELRAQLAELRASVDDLASRLDESQGELRHLRDALGA